MSLRNTEYTIRRRCTRGAMAAGVIVIALLAGCSSSGNKSGTPGNGDSGSSGGSGIPAGPITFGETLPLSGPLGATGNFEKAAAETVVSVMNANGGIEGHQLKLVTLDDKGDPATALANARTLVSKKVAGIVNESLGAASELTLPYFMKVGIPSSLAESNTSFLDVSKYPAYFTPYASAAQYAAAYVAYAKAHGLNDLGNLSDGTPIANQASDEVNKLAPAAGLKVTTSLTYSPTAVDLTTQVRKLKDAGTQVVVMNGYAEASNVFSAMQQIGWSPVVMGIGASTATTASLGDVQHKAFAPCIYYYSSASQQPSGMAKQALAKMIKIVGNNASASSVLGFFDMFLTLKAGIVKANSTDYSAVVQALDSGTTVNSVWPGVSYHYSATNHEGWPDGKLQLCNVQPLGYGGVPIKK